MRIPQGGSTSFLYLYSALGLRLFYENKNIRETISNRIDNDSIRNPLILNTKSDISNPVVMRIRNEDDQFGYIDFNILLYLLGKIIVINPEIIPMAPNSNKKKEINLTITKSV